MPTLRFTQIGWCPWGGVLTCVVSSTLIATTAVAQSSLGGFSHFSSQGRPPRWNDGPVQPAPGSWHPGPSVAASTPGLGSCGGVGLAGGSSRGEPEHVQLLRLSIELTQQARFSEAKTALGAAAHLTGGSPDVLAQAEVLRWRMGLRQASAVEVETWLGWSRAMPGTSGPTAVGSSNLGEPAEPDWAEVPSSAPRDHTLTTPEAGGPPRRSAALVLAFSAILAVGMLLLLKFYWSAHPPQSEAPKRSKGVDAVPTPQTIATPQCEAAEAPAPRQEAEQQEEEPTQGALAADPALDVGTDDDFLAGLEGLDEGQQLSGVGGDGDSGCSGDGSSSASEDGCGHSMPPEAPEVAAAESDPKEMLAGKAGAEETDDKGPHTRREAALKDGADDSPTAVTQQLQGSQQDVPHRTCQTADEEAVPGRRWGRSGEDVEPDVDSELALGAVDDMFLEDEDWEDAAEKPPAADGCAAASEATKEDIPEAEVEDSSKQQRRVRWGYERRAEWVEDEDEEDPDEDDVEDYEEDDGDAEKGVAHGGESSGTHHETNEWEMEDEAEEAGLDGYADDEWEDVSHSKAADGNDLLSSPATPAPGSMVERPILDDVKGSTNEPRTLLLSQFLPSAADDPAVCASSAATTGHHHPDDPESAAVAGAETGLHPEQHTIGDGEHQDWQDDAEEDDEQWQGEVAEGQAEVEAEDLVEEEDAPEADLENANQQDEFEYWQDSEDPRSQGQLPPAELDMLKSSSAEVGKHIMDDGDWAWGQEAEVTEEEEEELEFDGEEARQAALAMAAAWKPSKACWEEGDLISQLSIPSSSGLPHGADRYYVQKQKPTGSGAHQQLRQNFHGAHITEAPLANESFDNEWSGDEVGSKDEEDGNYVHFAAPSRTGRTWYPANATSGKKASNPDASANPQKDNALIEEGFVPGRPSRFRPTGCFVRLRGGHESFLPVEHIEPRTAATTTAIRERMRSIEQLMVREVDEETVSMLSVADAKKRAGELEARHSLMEEGIAVLRGNYDPRKWMSGSISAVQGNGVYVSVVEGKDAFVPVAEMPDTAIAPSTDADRPKPTLQPGQAVQFRVIRHSWQTDSFVASMLSYEESVAKRRGGTVDGPRSAPSAAATLRASEDSEERTSAQRNSEASPELSKTAKRLADKGFSIVDTSTASELNSWLQQSLLESKAAKTRSKAGIQSKTEKTYIVNIVRGMNGKVIGQLDMPTRASEKEVKDGALEMVKKAGELKAGQDHKGVMIAKNIITVKL